MLLFILKEVFLVKYHNANHLFPMVVVFLSTICQTKFLWLNSFSKLLLEKNMEHRFTIWRDPCICRFGDYQLILSRNNKVWNKIIIQGTLQIIILMKGFQLGIMGFGSLEVGERIREKLLLRLFWGHNCTYRNFQK